MYEIWGRLAELLVKDDIERIKATEKNDPSQFSDKSEWIRFTVMNLYECYKQTEFMHLKKMHVKIKKSWWTRDGKKKDEFIINDVNK